MKKLILLIALLIIFTGYAYHVRMENSVPNLSIPQKTEGKQTSSSIPSNKLKDGVYTGNSEDAFYGTIQVQTTIADGKITNVSFLQYPHDAGESIEVNTQAMPLLKQETLQVQSAHVDVISGATQTSNAFIQSLGTAIEKAE